MDRLPEIELKLSLEAGSESVDDMIDTISDAFESGDLFLVISRHPYTLDDAEPVGEITSIQLLPRY